MIWIYKQFFLNKSLVVSSCIALCLLIGSLIVNFYAWQYADESQSNPVTDIILSNTNTYDVDWFFLYGMIAFAVFIGVRCIRYPHQIPYILKSLATFIVIRSIFISLTHIGPFPNGVAIDNTGLLWNFNFWADLFFSGHTGMPFLMALIFWRHTIIRYIFIVSAVFFGIIVLLWHLHYSIDVFAAFFITYSINHICELIWKWDHKHFQEYDSLIYPKKIESKKMKGK